MVNVPNALPPDYWSNFSFGKSDIEFVSTYLFDSEIPLTEKEIVPILVSERIGREREAIQKKQQGDTTTYLPEGSFRISEKLTFPALGWQKGVVVGLRPGISPDVGEFDVIAVEFDDGKKKQFAARLADHKLNHAPEFASDDESLNPVMVIASHGVDLEAVIAKGLHEDVNLVQIAGRWFPRALLMDVGVGHLNLAEAVLDEASGKPLSTGQLIEQISLPGKENQNLIEFSMNFALQEDGRFDEVGPAGEVLWCLKRLEPADIQHIPLPLRYQEIAYDRSVLTKEMLALEAAIDDELGEGDAPAQDISELTISLTYPHWRAGTLPVSARTRKLFPTSYESDRVRFTLLDNHSKDEVPAWVARRHGYVAGLKDIYQKYGLLPGSLVTLRRSQKTGQVIIEARTRRPTRDWVRTVLVGSDGGIVFANLKQNLTTEFNERMVIAVPDAEGVDAACKLLTKDQVSFEDLVANMMRELTKLNVQGHVHAQELYSALNIIRRCPPAPLLGHLTKSSQYKHVGDLHFRIADKEPAND